MPHLNELLSLLRPYRVYVALLSQEGTADPTVVIRENTLGGEPVWTRADRGLYIGTLAGAFTNIPALSIQQSNAGNNGIGSDVDNIQVFTLDFSGEPIDGTLSSITVKVCVYD